jgi:hypothetical protein
VTQALLKSRFSIACIAENLLEKIANKPDYQEIFLDWEKVVGKNTASVCAPYKAINLGKDKILVLRTINGRGLEVAHDACRILESVNGFLKKKTFSQIKVIQTEALSSLDKST